MGSPPSKRRMVSSFVIRSTRMSRGQRRAYDSLYGLYCIPFEKRRVALEEFSSGGENFLEIGFGMGEATAEFASRYPSRNYLGVEVHRPGVGKLLSEIERRGLKNLKIIQYDVIPVLEEMIPDDVFNGVHIFFPDPWHKRKHTKRRLIQSEFVELLASKIKIGGYIYCVTDWEDYALQIMEVLSGTSRLENAWNGWAMEPVWRPTTKFERKGVAKGHRIFELFFTRCKPD